MNIIVFSKDRAMQLDLCLRSIKKYVEHQEVIVILAWSDPKYLDGYSKLLDRHRDVFFIKQGNFKRTLKITVEDCGHHFVTMVDDSIFVREFTKDNFINLFVNMETFDSIKCASLMLSPKIDY